MEMRQYRDTDVKVSLLGMGCMRLPKVDPEKEDIDYEKRRRSSITPMLTGSIILTPLTAITAASRSFSWGKL